MLQHWKFLPQFARKWQVDFRDDHAVARLLLTELGATAGAAGPEELAPGIAKALFHTLLGLMLAIPALGLFGFFRARVDRICNRGLRISGDLVERLIKAPS